MKRRVPKKTAAKKVAASKKKQMPDDSFKVMDGIPRTAKRSSPEDERRIINALNQLQPYKNHAVIATNLRAAVKRVAEKEFPEWHVVISTNKEKKILNVWRKK